MKKTFKKVNGVERFAETVINCLEHLKDGIPTWVRPWSKLDISFRNIGGNIYKGLVNQLVCSLKGKDDPRFLTDKQIKDNGGRKVKGCKAVSLVVWNSWEKEVVNKKTGKEEKETVWFAGIRNVYSVEDITGLDLEPIKTVDHGTNPNKKVLDLVIKMGVKINTGGSKAFHNKDTREITMPKASLFKSQSQWSATMLHELIHWTGPDVKRSKPCYAKEELVAELGSMKLCQVLGIDGFMDINHLSYIDNWLTSIKGDKYYIYNACKEAQKAVDFILAD